MWSRRAWIVAATIAVIGCGLFLTKLQMVGWIRGGAPTHAVIEIDPGTNGVQWLHRKEWMFEAWIHHIRPGEVVPFHQHPRRNEMVAIVRGQARVTGLRKAPTSGPPLERVEDLDAGNLVFSRSRTIHQFENPTSDPLWCLVFMSRTFRGNRTWDGASSLTSRDFFVVPWKRRGEARGAGHPTWSNDFAGEGPIPYFESMPGQLRRGFESLETAHPESESWTVLLSGSGRLEIAGETYAIAAPTFVYETDSDWKIESDTGEEIAVIEFTVPRFIARSFALGVYEQYLSGLFGLLP